MLYLLLTANLWFSEPKFELPPQCDLAVVSCSPMIKNYIKQEFDKAGLNGDRAVKIVNCESRFKADAISPTNDYGYFQFNRRWWPEIVKECFGQPNQLICEVRYAVDKVKRDGDWGAWSCSRKVDNF